MAFIFLCCAPFGIAFLILATIFWVWMIVDCAMNETDQGNDKIVWVLVILFTHWIGALLYFLIRRPERKRTLGR